jgi:hypothetical protein
MTDVTNAVAQLFDAVGDASNEAAAKTEALFKALSKDRALKAALRPLADVVNSGPTAVRLLQRSFELPRSEPLFQAAAAWFASRKPPLTLLVPLTSLSEAGPQPSREVQVLLPARDGRCITAAELKVLSVWSTQTGAHQEDVKLPSKGVVTWLTELADGTLRAHTTKGEVVERRAGKKAEVVGRVPGHDAGPQAFGGTRWLASRGSAEGAEGPRDTVELWDLDERVKRWEWAHTEADQSVAFVAALEDRVVTVLVRTTFGDDGSHRYDARVLSLSLSDGALLGTTAVAPGENPCSLVVARERVWLQTGSSDPATGWAWYALAPGGQLVPAELPPGATAQWFANDAGYGTDAAVYDAGGQLVAQYLFTEDFDQLVTAIDVANHRLVLAGSNVGRVPSRVEK